MKMSIKKQLFVFLVCFVLLGAMAIGSVMYMFVYSRMTEFVLGEIDMNIKGYTQEIDSILTGVQRFNEYISFDEKIAEGIKRNSSNPTELISTVGVVEDEYKRFHNIFFADASSIVTPRFLINTGVAVEKYLITYKGTEFFEHQGVFLYKNTKTIEEITGKVNEFNEDDIISFYDAERPGSVFFAQKIYDNVAYDGSYLGINLVEVKLGELLLKYRSSNMAEAATVVVMDEESNVISTAEELENEKLFSVSKKIGANSGYSKVNIDSERYLVKKYPIGFGINLLAFARPDYISQRLGEMWKYILIALLVVIGVLICFANIMANFLSRPIVRLSRTMAKFDENTGVLPKVGKANPQEIKELYNCFVLMVSRIKELLLKTKESAKKEKELEMQMLGAQINPHFLYNALDSISWMAIDKGEDEIAEMIDILSDSFRYSIKQTKDLISIRDEMKFIIGYLQLQEMRYKDKFIFTLDISSEDEKKLIPKFIIQPLVENFVIHAINPEGKNVLTISAKEEDGFMYILVSDNGKGCDTDALNRYIEGDETVFSKEKIGIKNVNSRIKIKFGDKYGLSYLKSESGGTKAKLKLPVIIDKGSEEEGNV